MYALAYFLVYSFLKLVHRYKVYNKETIPKGESLIIASNHASYYDPVVLAAAIYPQRLNFMAKMELFKNPLFSKIIRYFGAFPVKRTQFDRKALSTALDLLKKQKIVGIFPQGTRSNPANKEQQIFQGASYLALKSGSKVLPVGISGTDRISKGSFFLWPAKITIRFGELMELKNENKAEMVEFSDRIIKEISFLCK